MNIFWERGQHRRIERARDEAEQARLDVRELQYEVERLAERADKALLVAETLWTVLVDKVGISEAELLARFEELDLKGDKDGAAAPEPARCPSCDRVLSKRRANCIYCGQEVERGLFD